jgi:uncharacterized protein YegP (UPF0339 family)
MKLIPISGIHGKDKYIKVDDEDYDELSKYTWHINNRGYAYRNQKIVFAHRQIMDTPEDKVVDHVNHDTLDNQKTNLRNCTQLENTANNYMSSTNSSGYKGVYRDKRGKYRAQIRYNNKRIWIGYYDTAEEAGEAYNKKAFELRGFYHRVD